MSVVTFGPAREGSRAEQPSFQFYAGIRRPNAIKPQSAPAAMPCDILPVAGTPHFQCDVAFFSTVGEERNLCLRYERSQSRRLAHPRRMRSMPAAHDSRAIRTARALSDISDIRVSRCVAVPLLRLRRIPLAYALRRREAGQKPPPAGAKALPIIARRPDAIARRHRRSG
jgi:hypothetical protein